MMSSELRLKSSEISPRSSHNNITRQSRATTLFGIQKALESLVSVLLDEVNDRQHQQSSKVAQKVIVSDFRRLISPRLDSSDVLWCLQSRFSSSLHRRLLSFWLLVRVQSSTKFSTLNSLSHTRKSHTRIGKVFMSAKHFLRIAYQSSRI